MRLSTYFLLVPVAVIAAALAVANRAMVSFSLDPFSDVHPALVIQMPLFLLLFLTLLLGVMIGGMAAMIGRRYTYAGATRKQDNTIQGTGPYRSRRKTQTGGMTRASSNPICVALDTPDLKRAAALIKAVRPYVGGLKVGL